MASSYVYRGHLPRDYIRLLKLTSDGSRFSGDLEEFHMESLPYFIALSWCWSSGTNAQAILSCEDQDFIISSHLYSALQHLLPQGSAASLRIWVDAICINQNLVEEKNAHVPRMHEIYGKARIVAVWLGDSDRDSELVLQSQTLIKFAQKLSAFPDYVSSNDVTQYGLPAPSDSLWQALGRFCERDWFYRTWVVQEVALARKLHVLCGYEWAEWEKLVSMVSSISRTGLSVLCRDPNRTSIQRPNGFGVLLDLSFTRTMHRERTTSTSYLLHMVRLKEVKKPIDKVYGLLGILESEVRDSVKIDYVELEMQYWKVFVNLAKFLLAKKSALWIFCMASSKARPEGLPTWCPNLNSLAPEKLNFSHQPWRCGIQLGQTYDNVVQFIPDSPRIKVRGFVLDVVENMVHLGQPSAAIEGQQDLGPDGNRARFLKLEASCYELAQSLIQAPDLAPEAYACTLIINTWADGSTIAASQRGIARQAYLDARIQLAQNREEDRDDGEAERQARMHQYIRQLGWWQDRPFYTTRRGRIGRGPFNLRSGDHICAFYGAGPAFALRFGDGGQAQLIGDAYLHGCMDFEAISPVDRGQDQEFILG